MASRKHRRRKDRPRTRSRHGRGPKPTREERAAVLATWPKIRMSLRDVSSHPKLGTKLKQWIVLSPDDEVAHNLDFVVKFCLATHGIYIYADHLFDNLTSTVEITVPPPDGDSGSNSDPKAVFVEYAAENAQDIITQMLSELPPVYRRGIL